MIVHIKTYEVDSLGTSLDWIRERADQLRSIEGRGTSAVYRVEDI